MRHAETMEDVLRYIDEHISQGLTAEELARVSGYSFYHFCHLFAIAMPAAGTGGRGDSTGGKHYGDLDKKWF